MSWIRIQQCAASLHYSINMLTVSLDLSMQGRHWQPLSVHLWAHCNPPIAHDMNDAWKVNNTTGETSCTHFPTLVLVLLPPPPSPSIYLMKEGWKIQGQRANVPPPPPPPMTRSSVSPVCLKTLVVEPAGIWTHDPPLSIPALSHGPAELTVRRFHFKYMFPPLYFNL